MYIVVTMATLKQIEKRAGSGPNTIKLLRVDRGLYSKYRNGTRTVPRYIQASIEAHMLLTDEQFNKLLEKRI